MHPREILFLATSVADLEDIAVYLLREASEQTMIRFLDSVQTTALSLQTMPSLGIQIISQRPELTGVRRVPVSGFGKWLIFYRTSTSAIEVIRVLHGAQDWATLLG